MRKEQGLTSVLLLSVPQGADGGNDTPGVLHPGNDARFFENFPDLRAQISVQNRRHAQAA